MSKFFILAVVLLSTVYADQKISFARSSGKAYLQALSEADKEAYFDIVRSKTLTLKQIEEKKLEFAAKHGFDKDIKEELEAHKANHAKVVAERPKILASLADVSAKLDAIYANKDITIQQQQEKLSALTKEHRVAVRALQVIASSINGKRNVHGGKFGGVVATKVTK